MCDFNRRFVFVILCVALLWGANTWLFAEQEKAAKADRAETSEKESNADAAKVEQPDPTEIYLIAPSGQYVDLVQPLGIDATSLLLGGAATKQKSFYRLCEHMDELASESNPKHIVLDLSSSDLSMNSAQLDELTRRLENLKTAGKKLYCWLVDASNVQLSLASVCDHVIMADFGGIDMPSVSIESLFFRDAMDLVGVKASVVRAGEYKGAVEPYTNSVMSDSLRAHYKRMLKTMNDALISRIATGRKIPKATLRELQARRILTSSEAREVGLVDRLAPFGAMKETIASMVEGDVKWTTPKSKPKRQMTFFELMGRMMAGPKSTRLTSASIVVFHLSGPIVSGVRIQPGTVVSGPTVAAIEKLIEDKNVKGVVVRVNSPGGSATASEAIRRSLERLAAAKPTVVSMGNVAASGGYWVSCIGTPIHAEKGSLTGSIGVFSIKFSFGSLMRRVGVHLESVTLDDSAAAFSMDRPWTEDEKETVNKVVAQAYDKFLTLVSASREIPKDEVKPIAGGRVWSGSQAKSLGLVDEIGGVDGCLSYLARQAELNDYKIVHRPTVKSGLELLELFGSGDEEEILDSIYDSAAIRALRRRGFSLEATLTLLRDAVGHHGRKPTTWLMIPAEFRIE